MIDEIMSATMTLIIIVRPNSATPAWLYAFLQVVTDGKIKPKQPSMPRSLPSPFTLIPEGIGGPTLANLTLPQEAPSSTRFTSAF